MAALTMTPSRQPFASLDSPRMRPVMRSKLNRQNQLNGAALSAKASPIFVDDAENIDPATLNLSGKRKRSWDDEDDVSKDSPKPLKTSPSHTATINFNFNIHYIEESPVNSQIRSQSQARWSVSTPKSSKTPGRRSTIAKSRPQPNKRGGVARPFSLAAAFSQGKTSSSTPKPQAKAPASWFFDIHVDSEQEEMTNLMQHSTGVLDISDDEGKEVVTDGRGKENVPPSELGLDLPRSPNTTSAVAAADTRKASKMEEDRSPLGELTASDYYAEDCNAFSYAVVHDDEVDSITTPASAPVPEITRTQATFVSPAITASIDSLLASTTPTTPNSDPIKKTTEDVSPSEKRS
ncbi:hypothetical protein N7450_003518 [Penicillium hetheringtonii]|uniref:Uncharacterized protein n=1 Tax=Penicillium hetheringtonii TaxID=911720 RepID=A0AAD6DXY9_9EURO|nr:hypothetical protein N7450_003518 [Penicillium hetheringtonii]